MKLFFTTIVVIVVVCNEMVSAKSMWSNLHEIKRRNHRADNDGNNFGNKFNNINSNNFGSNINNGNNFGNTKTINVESTNNLSRFKANKRFDTTTNFDTDNFGNNNFDRFDNTNFDDSSDKFEMFEASPALESDTPRTFLKVDTSVDTHHRVFIAGNGERRRVLQRLVALIDDELDDRREEQQEGLFDSDEIGQRRKDVVQQKGEIDESKQVRNVADLMRSVRQGVKELGRQIELTKRKLQAVNEDSNNNENNNSNNNEDGKDINNSKEEERLPELSLAAQEAMEEALKELRLRQMKAKVKAKEIRLILAKLDKLDNNEESTHINSVLDRLQQKRLGFKQALEKQKQVRREKERIAEALEKRQQYLRAERLRLANQLRAPTHHKEDRRLRVSDRVNAELNRRRLVWAKKEELRAHRTLAAASNERVISKLRHYNDLRRQREQQRVDRLVHEALLQQRLKEQQRQLWLYKPLRATKPPLILSKAQRRQLRAWLDLERNAQVLENVDKKVADKARKLMRRQHEETQSKHLKHIKPAQDLEPLQWLDPNRPLELEHSLGDPQYYDKESEPLQISDLVGYHPLKSDLEKEEKSLLQDIKDKLRLELELGPGGQRVPIELGRIRASDEQFVPYKFEMGDVWDRQDNSFRDDSLFS